jgi:hypothetical protein
MKIPLHHLAWGFVPLDECFPNPSLLGSPTPFRFAHEGEGRIGRRGIGRRGENTRSRGQTADTAPLPSPSMHFL